MRGGGRQHEQGRSRRHSEEAADAEAVGGHEAFAEMPVLCVAIVHGFCEGLQRRMTQTLPRVLAQARRRALALVHAPPPPPAPCSRRSLRLHGCTGPSLAPPGQERWEELGAGTGVSSSVVDLFRQVRSPGDVPMTASADLPSTSLRPPFDPPSTSP